MHLFVLTLYIMKSKILVMKVVRILIPLAILNLPTGGEGEANVLHATCIIVGAYTRTCMVVNCERKIS